MLPSGRLSLQQARRSRSKFPHFLGTTNTDRGSTYTAAIYRARLLELGMTQSMSRRGNCWDNAVAESTIGSIKAELFDRVPVDIHDVRHQLFEYIESFYNRHRLHSTLDYITPNEKQQLMAAEKVA